MEIVFYAESIVRQRRYATEFVRARMRREAQLIRAAERAAAREARQRPAFSARGSHRLRCIAEPPHWL